MAFLILIIFAAYVLVGRIALSLLPDYRQELEQYLSEQTQLPVTIKSLHGKWVGFDPVVEIEGLSINGAENAQVGRIRIHLAILKSLLANSPRLKSVILDHSVFTLRQQQEGDWKVAGLIVDETFGKGEAPGQPLGLVQLFDGTHVTLNDNLLSVYDRKGRLRDWRLPLVSLDYKGDQVFASGHVLQPEGRLPLLSFSYEGDGVLSGDKVSGSLYLEARSSEFLDEVLRAYEWQGLSVRDIDASARMWVSLEGTDVKKVQGDIQVSELNWKSSQKSLPPLMNVVARFQWTDLVGLGQLDAHWNAFSWAGQHCKSGSVRIKLANKQTRIQIAALDIRCLSRISVAMDLLPHKLQNRLEVSDPYGYLSNIQLTLTDEPVSGQTPFQFEAELNNVSLGAYSGTPGITGIDGYVVADLKGGSIVFDSARFELAFPDLFLLPWKMKRTEGAVSWSVEGDDISVFSDGLRLRMADDSLVYGDFMLRLNPPEKEDYLNLALGLQDVAFEDVTRFVPYYLVDESVYSWLDQSLLKGQVARGIYRGYGSIESDDSVNSFTSSLFAQTHRGELLFAEGWPNLSNLNASVYLQNGALAVQAETASIHDTDLMDLVALMPESEDDRAAVLNAKAKIRADEQTLQYWLNESPIAEHTAMIAEQIDIRGAFDVALDIDVPMDSALPVGYEITSTLNEVEIEHPGSSLVFKHVQGQLGVSSRSGVFAKDIQTELLGQPASLSIATLETESLPGEEPAYQTVLSLDGRASVAALLENYQLESIDGLSGMFDYQSKLRLPGEGDDYPMFTLSSDLLGVSQAWPAPFDKASTASALLKLALMIKPDQMYVNGSIKSEQAPNVEGELLFVNNEFSYGEVLVGGVNSGSRVTTGLNVRAALPELTLEPWITFVQEIMHRSDDAGGKPVLERLDIDASRLNAFGQTFNNTRALFNREPSRWAINLQGDDIAGHILLPVPDTLSGRSADSDEMEIQLEHLSLVSKEGDVDTLPAKQKAVRFDPRELPAMTFSSKQLSVNDQRYGAWRTRIEPNQHGVIFRELEGFVDGASIQGQLNWQRLSEQQHNSILTLDVSGENVEHFVQSMGWPSALSSGHYQSELALVWSDEPTAFDMANVSGSIDINMQDGALKTEDEKTGALRLFGILNADAIFKRLTLDFSDLYESGVSYDELTVRATIDQGKLVLEQPLLISGPSSSYTVNGTADLTNKTLDMDMLVELPFSQNVPLAALVLGAPQIGGAVWLVDKLLGEPLSAITTARYDITGSWEKPKVEMQQAINATKKKRAGRKGSK